MSASKRARPYDDDDDDIVSQRSSVHSALRASTSKRSRIALAAEHGGSTFSDEDDDETNEERAIPRFASIVPDGIDYNSDEDDLEADEEICTRYMRNKLKELQENVPQPNGIIEEVLCINFMCHAKLRITLGPLINFICGHNGSGKSAVLTALTICLGSKASSTNRGTSIKDMIKEGQDTATLQVKIKNQEPGAYRPDLYGRSIIVERHIPRNSAPSFKLKSADGKIISTKRRDLDDMLDFYSLQLDNPINVLTQDNARQFLANSTASDKYKFYIKGTLLENLDNDYRLLEAHIDLIDGKLVSMRDDIAILKSEEREAAKRKEHMKKNDSIRLRVKDTQRMHAWAQVEEQERILDDCVREVANAEAKLHDAEEAVQDASGTYEGRNQSQEQARRFLQDLQREAEPLETDYQACRAEFDEGTQKLMELQESTRTAKSDWKSLQERRRRMQQNLDTELRIIAEADGSGHLARTEKLREAKQNAIAAKEERERLEGLTMGLELSTKAAEQTVRDFADKLEDGKRAAERAQSDLEQLERAQDRRFAAYPRDMPRLVHMIEQETRWRHKPVGPLGLCLQVKDQRWAGLLERTLGGLLNSFVVTCREDQILFRSIVDRLNFQVPAFIITDQLLDTADKEPAGGVRTMLQMLEISDNLVRNVLIIQSAAEQVVLIGNRHEAYDYAYGGPRPSNVKATLTFADKGGHGVRFDYSRSGLARSNPITTWQGASRFCVNRDEQIGRQRTVASDAAQAYDTALREHRQLQQSVKSAKEACFRHKQARMQALREEQRLQDDVEAAEEEMERNRPKDGHLQELQRQVAALQEDEDGQKAIVNDLYTTKGTIDGQQAEIKLRLDQATEAKQDHHRRLLDAQQKFDETDDRRNNALREKNRAIERVKDLQTELEKAQKEREAQERTVRDDFVAQAESICPRVPVEPGMTPDLLDARLERFMQDLKRTERQAGGTLEELTAAALVAKNKYDDARLQCDALEHFNKVAHNSWNTRTKRWKLFRRYIGMRAMVQFKYLLSERGFRGDLKIDNINKLLDISVEPNMLVNSDAGREARTLSGGEKSFATICLLLSIWEAIASPIRCLDEFDVFMDSVNRNESVRMICENARRSVGRQFILITPQSMQNIQEKDDVTIYKMPDPERGQQTLPFTQAR